MKINVKATIFLSAIVLVVVVLLLNLIEFRKTVDFTVPGIQMPKENAFGKQEGVQVSVNGTYYYRVLPWIHGSTFHGQISFVGEGEEPQNYFFTYGASRGFLKEGRGAGWIGTPDAQTTVAIYQAVQNVEKGMISVENPASYVLYPAATPEEAYAIADIWYPGMLENEAKTAFCAAFLPDGVPAEDRLQLLHGGLRLCGRCRYRRAAVAGIYTAFRKSDVRSDPAGRDGGRCGIFSVCLCRR